VVRTPVATLVSATMYTRGAAAALLLFTRPHATMRRSTPAMVALAKAVRVPACVVVLAPTSNTTASFTVEAGSALGLGDDVPVVVEFDAAAARLDVDDGVAAAPLGVDVGDEAAREADEVALGEALGEAGRDAEEVGVPDGVAAMDVEGVDDTSENEDDGDREAEAGVEVPVAVRVVVGVPDADMVDDAEDADVPVDDSDGRELAVAVAISLLEGVKPVDGVADAVADALDVAVSDAVNPEDGVADAVADALPVGVVVSLSPPPAGEDEGVADSLAAATGEDEGVADSLASATGDGVAVAVAPPTAQLPVHAGQSAVGAGRLNGSDPMP
jgi:hypothetical protein